MITDRTIAREMGEFYHGLKPTVEAWQKETNVAEKERIKERIRAEIKARKNISQSRIEATFPTFERGILNAAYTLSRTGLTPIAFDRILADIVAKIGRRHKIEGRRLAMLKTKEVLKKLATEARKIEGMSSKGAQAFFKEHPAEFQFFLGTLDVFSGAENLYNTNIGLYLNAICDEIEERLQHLP